MGLILHVADVLHGHCETGGESCYSLRCEHRVDQLMDTRYIHVSL